MQDFCIQLAALKEDLFNSSDTFELGRTHEVQAHYEDQHIFIVFEGQEVKLTREGLASFPIQMVSDFLGPDVAISDVSGMRDEILANYDTWKANRK